MPTGYTSDVADGKIKTLREYALRCARGMGACIPMRDEPWDASIPAQFEPNVKYHDERLSEARATLAEISGLGSAECAKRAQGAFEEDLARWSERREKDNHTQERYADMLAQVTAWYTEAEGIKSFMGDQLRQSMKFDCGDEKYDLRPEPKTPEDWRRGVISQAAKDIGYHEQKIAEEIARTATRNRWLKALMDSLPDDPAEKAE